MPVGGERAIAQLGKVSVSQSARSTGEEMPDMDLQRKKKSVFQLHDLKLLEKMTLW